jgi:PBP1b-binding outer membrane lipoprotein LpoB
MKTLRNLSTVLAVFIMALALPLSSCSSEPQTPPSASNAIMDAAKAENRPLTKAEEVAIEESAAARVAKITAEQTKGFFEPKEN